MRYLQRHYIISMRNICMKAIVKTVEHEKNLKAVDYNYWGDVKFILNVQWERED